MKFIYLVSSQDKDTYQLFGRSLVDCCVGSRAVCRMNRGRLHSALGSCYSALKATEEIDHTYWIYKETDQIFTKS